MPEVGKRLKESREGKGMSIEEVHAKTKIQIRLLKSLESGDYSHFPGDVYVKGAIKNYAQILGLNGQELIEMYKNEINPSLNDDISAAKKSTDIKEGSAKTSEKEIPEKALHKAKIKEFSQKNSKIKLSKRAYLMFFLIIVAIAFYFSIPYLPGFGDIASPNLPENGAEPLVEHNDPIEPDDELESPTDTEDKELKNGQEETRSISLSLVESDTTNETYKLSNVGSIEMEVVLTDRCWTVIEADGNQIYKQEFSAGNNLNITAENTIFLRMGAPKAVQVSVNGIELEIRDTNSPYNITIERE